MGTAATHNSLQNIRLFREIDSHTVSTVRLEAEGFGAILTFTLSKSDFAVFIRDFLNEYTDTCKLHIVLDNLNTHFPVSFEEAFGRKERESIMSRVEFHYAPKHASWLNIAEIEINVMDIECTGRRFDNRESLEKEVAIWAAKRNAERKKIKWGFTREQADRKLSKYYTT